MSATVRSLTVCGFAALTTMLTASTGLTPAVAQLASAPAPTLEPVTGVTLHGVCHGGGRITLTAQKTDAGDEYVMTATTRGLPEGSRWRGGLIEASDVNPDEWEGANFHAKAVDGGWTVSKTVPAIEVPYFDAVAFGPGRAFGPHLCSVLTSPARPYAGLTTCRQGISLVIFATHRKDGALVARWGAEGMKPGTTWNVEFSVETDDGGATSGDRVKAGPRRFIQGKMVVSDMRDPRLKLKVLSDHGQRCSLGLLRSRAVPITDPPPPPLQQGASSLRSDSATLRTMRSMTTSQQRLVGLLR